LDGRQCGIGEASQELWLALSPSVAALLPPAVVFMVLAMKPCREDVERIEALET
jgi:hypothetical protein